jgi:hypothetical protein
MIAKTSPNAKKQRMFWIFVNDLESYHLNEIQEARQQRASILPGKRTVFTSS